MGWLTDPLELEFMQRALLEVALLAVPAGLLGTWIVLRRLAFFAHAAGSATFPGLVVAGPCDLAPQLAALGAGQHVKIHVDAYPDREIDGTIESVSPASGSVFSLLPAENATGNFTKIVQRVPVRISVPDEVAQQGILRPGLSVVVSVDSRDHGSEPQRTAQR